MVFALQNKSRYPPHPLQQKCLYIGQFLRRRCHQAGCRAPKPCQINCFLTSASVDLSNLPKATGAIYHPMQVALRDNFTFCPSRQAQAFITEAIETGRPMRETSSQPSLLRRNKAVARIAHQIPALPVKQPDYPASFTTTMGKRITIQRGDQRCAMTGTAFTACWIKVSSLLIRFVCCYCCDL